MTSSDRLILGTFSLLGLVVGFVIGYLVLDSVVSGAVLAVGLGLAFAAGTKVARGKNKPLFAILTAMSYGLFGSFIAKKGKRDELLQILLDASEALQQNDNCIHYIVSTASDPNAVWVYETWTSKEAHEKSLTPENIRLLIQKAMPLIERVGEGSVELYTVGGKGM